VKETDEIDKLWYRIRGLEEMEKRFGNNLIQKYIKRKLQIQKEVKVLEIGFGEGRCLIDLRNKFPQKKLKLYGINNIKEGNMYKRMDFFHNAKKFGIEIPEKNLPTPYFYDVGDGLKFDDNYFDVIISQVCIPYVGNKAKLLEEVWRVLKKGSRAFIHFDDRIKNIGCPDFFKLKNDTPRMVIYFGDRIIPTKSIFTKVKKEEGVNINLYRHLNIIVTMKKNIEILNFNLEYDGISTLYLSERLYMSDEYKKDKEIWWGTRSVFRVIDTQIQKDQKLNFSF
jgi:ubiquinone/menaquinone biosynthesis C-methylase UbiE